MDLYHSFHSVWFAIGVAGIVALLFSAPGHTDAQGKSYSIASLLLPLKDNAGMIREDVTGMFLLSSGMSGMFRVFSIICISIPFVMNLSMERTSGYVRFLGYYAGTGEYILSKTCAGLISGGVTGTAGFSVYAVILMLAVKLQGQELALGSILGYAMGILVYGAVSMGWIFLFAAWIRNKYILLCLPFLTQYLYLQILFKIKIQLLELGKTDECNLIKRMEPDSLIYSFTARTRDWGLMLHCLFVILSIILFYFGMKRRRDLGE